MGVFLFFALSGFLLSKPFFDGSVDLMKPSILFAYFIRRIFRIIPLYIFLLISLVALGMRDPQWFGNHLIFKSAEFHLWSIRQELGFYLLLPIVIILLLSVKLRILAFFSVLLSAVLIENELIDLWQKSGWPGTNEPPYLSIFIFGVLAAYAREKIQFATPSWLGFVALMALILCSRSLVDGFLQLITLEPLDVWPGWTYPNTFGLLAAVAVSSSSTPQKSLNRVLSFKPLQLCGIYGYSIYIWHWYVRDLLSSWGLGFGTMLFLSTLILTFALSLFTYHAIEYPSIRLGKKISEGISKAI